MPVEQLTNVGLIKSGGPNLVKAPDLQGPSPMPRPQRVVRQLQPRLQVATHVYRCSRSVTSPVASLIRTSAAVSCSKLQPCRASLFGFSGFGPRG